MEQHTQLSDSRNEAIRKLMAKFSVTREEALDALSARRDIYEFAEEYLSNKDNTAPEDSKYPLWTEYWEIVYASSLY